MVKKKSPKIISLPQVPLAPPPGPKRSHDKMMADLNRLLAQQNFESEADVNKFMQELMASGGGFVPEVAPQTALEEAQDIMFEAFESPNRRQRINLARKALKVSPDCADAYVLLAEETAKTPAEARALYEEGVKAGERALGADFEELKGSFWGFHETRPYMRARLGLAIVLVALGEREAAAEHMRAMLELNPDDNQGVRYSYLGLLLDLDDRPAIEKLLKKYKGDWSATWKYSAALFEFRKNGRGRKANKLLSDAISYNPHVPLFLLNKKKVPRQLPPYYSPGDESEAVQYLIDGARNWVQTEGALDWLRETMTMFG